MKPLIYTPPRSLQSSQEDFELEASLQWPRGTLSVLRNAFENKITRKHVWDLSSLPEVDAYKTASFYYMRGVPSIPGNVEKKAPMESPYSIEEKPNGEFLSCLQSHFVVCDENLSNAWPELLEGKVHCTLSEVSEEKKSLQRVAYILQVAKGHTPKPWLIIGGGITCDIAAFAAHLAGVEFTLVPTSLLAMVDASLGGKTGVNFPPYGKNLVGAFAFPQKVLIFTSWLQTLPNEEFYSGASECIKHALLRGDKDFMESVAEAFAVKDISKVCTLMESLIQVKANIVQRDPFEKGERAFLNLGHTLAHALEAISPRLRHGEAVAVGILFEAMLSNQFDFVFSLLTKSRCLLNRVSLEQRLSYRLDSISLYKRICFQMSFDKKNISSNEVCFVILNPQTHIKSLNRESFNEAWWKFASQFP